MRKYSFFIKSNYSSEKNDIYSNVVPTSLKKKILNRKLESFLT